MFKDPWEMQPSCQQGGNWLQGVDVLGGCQLKHTMSWGAARLELRQGQENFVAGHKAGEQTGRVREPLPTGQ